jgi:hypothetical protein
MERSRGKFIAEFFWLWMPQNQAATNIPWHGRDIHDPGRGQDMLDKNMPTFHDGSVYFSVKASFYDKLNTRCDDMRVTETSRPRKRKTSDSHCGKRPSRASFRPCPV